MAYDQGLAQRLREVLEERPDVTEKEMFGGLAFLLHGNMFIGIVHEDLMARVGPDQHDAALGRPHARPMDFAGRPMNGFVYVAPEGIDADAALAAWVDLALRFVSTLPAKEAKPERAKKPGSKAPAATAKAKTTKAKITAPPARKKPAAASKSRRSA
jgi:TfoX/Sxy family transcriptional regulator of competence genes